MKKSNARILIEQKIDTLLDHTVTKLINTSNVERSYYGGRVEGVLDVIQILFGTDGVKRQRKKRLLRDPERE